MPSNPPQVIVCLPPKADGTQPQILRWTPSLGAAGFTGLSLPSVPLSGNETWYFQGVYHYQTGKKTYMFCADDSSGVGYMSMYRSADFGDNWHQITPVATDAVGACKILWVNDYATPGFSGGTGKIYAALHYNNGTGSKYWLCWFNPTTEVWTPIEQTPIGSWNLQVDDADGGKLYRIITSTSPRSAIYSTDHYSLTSRVTKQWDGAPTTRISIGVVDQYLHGISGSTLAEVWISKDRGDSFSKLATVTLGDRLFHIVQDYFLYGLTHKPLWATGKTTTTQDIPIWRIDSDTGAVTHVTETLAAGTWNGLFISCDRQTEGSVFALLQNSSTRALKFASITNGHDASPSSTTYDPSASDYTAGDVALMGATVPAFDIPKYCAFKELDATPDYFDISGNCHTPDGLTPVEGCHVTNDQYPYIYDTSDVNGDYTLSNLLGGQDYNVSAIKSGKICTAQFTNPITLTADVTGKDFHVTDVPTPDAPFDENVMYIYNFITRAWTSARTTKGKIATIYQGDGMGKLLMAKETMASGDKVSVLGAPGTNYELNNGIFEFGWDSFGDTMTTKIIDTVTIHGGYLSEYNASLWFKSENDTQWKAATALASCGAGAIQHKTFVVGTRSLGVYWKFRLVLMNAPADAEVLGGTASYYQQAETPAAFTD